MACDSGSGDHGPSSDYAYPPETVLQAARAMGSDSVSGPDNWDVLAIKALQPHHAPILSFIYACFGRAACWPTSVQVARTQLIPKNSEATDVQQQRPISVMSTWYRLWSRIALLCLPPELIPSLHRRVRGGLAGRSISDSVLGWALRVENAIYSRRRHGSASEDALHLISIDASKCFDRISQPQLLRLAAEHHIPPLTLSLLGSF